MPAAACSTASCRPAPPTLFAIASSPIRRWSGRPSRCRCCSRTTPTSTTRASARGSSAVPAAESATSGTPARPSVELVQRLRIRCHDRQAGAVGAGAQPAQGRGRPAPDHSPDRGAQGRARAHARARAGSNVAPRRHHDADRRDRDPVAKGQGARRSGRGAAGSLRRRRNRRALGRQGPEPARRDQRRPREGHAARQREGYGHRAAAAGIDRGRRPRNLADRDLCDAGIEPPRQRPRGRLARAPQGQEARREQLQLGVLHLGRQPRAGARRHSRARWSARP